MASIISAGNATNGLAISSDNTGILELKTGTGAGTTALTFSTAQAATFAGAVTASGLVTGATGALYPLVSGTSVSASGTAVDFTGIPSWAKRITVMFFGVSTSGTTPVIVQIGASSFTTTGYLGAVDSVASGISVVAVTTGFGVTDQNAAQAYSGATTILNINSNSWVAQSIGGISNSAAIGFGGGSVTISGTLDRVRVTTVNGTDTFDAGTINILYE